MLVFCLFLYLVAGVSGQGFSTTFLQNALFGGENSDFGVASYTDQARGIRYVVGQTYSTEFYGLSPLENSKEGGAPNVLIVALNQDSDSLLWFKIIGTSRSDQPRGITGDTQGNIWITGTTFGTFDDNETDGVSRGFVIKMDSNGSVLSSSTFNSCQPTSVVSDSNNNIWVVGSVANTKDSDEAASNEDVAIVLFSAETGKEIITETFGGSASDIAKIVVAGKNTISVGGTTQSSDFPFTLGTRECELCSSVGFIMTLDYDAEIGIQQKFSTYIAGKEYESLSVVSITYDSVDNMYLAIYDDANSMGSFIQQIKRDRSMGWTSEKSDAFWKVEYLPLINALYTIGTFSTPSDYTTFFVLDTKTGSSLYSSKALTGSLVDASVHNTEHGAIKINMVGTLTKEHRIASHGRTYITGHKTDDILLVSMVIHPLKHGSSKPAQVARGIEARDNVVASQCLWLHQNGFSSVNDLTTTYNVSGSAIVLPWEAGHADYDLEHASTLVKIVPANSLKPVRLPAGQWGTSYESYFRFGYNKGTTIPTGLTYIEYDVITAGIAKLIVSRTDSVAWTIKLQIISTNEMFTATLPTTVDAVVSVWVSYDGSSTTMADNIKVYASTDGVKPTVPAIKYTTTSAQNADWTNQNLVPALYSGSTTETLLIQSYICGINEVIKTIPVALSEVLPITGTTSFPAAGSGSVAYVAQVVIPSADSIEGTQTKFTILKANGEPYNSSMVFVYEKEYELGPEHLRKQYGEGFFASTSISGTGTLAGWVFPSTKKFIAGKRYYFYIASGLTDSDNLGTNNGGSKRDIESRDDSAPFLLYNSSTKKYEEVPGVKLVTAVTSKPLVADPLAQFDPPPPPPAPGTPPPPSDTGSGRGDPWFIGYNGQKFEFDGHAGGIYNLYNDQWVNVNSLFGYANEKKHRGTVMHAIGVSIGEHKLLMDITNRENKKIFDVVLDGKLTKIGYQVHHLTGCVDIQYNSKVILISTPRHSIRLTIQWGKNGHISENYFDIDIHHPEEDVTKIGGVLGQTAHEGVDDIDTLEEDFEISDIFSFEKSKFYNLQSVDC